MTEVNEMEELTEWERKAGEYQKRIFGGYGYSTKGLFANAVYTQLDGALSDPEIVDYMSYWLGEDYLSALSEYAVRVALTAHEKRPGWGNEADSRMVRFLDCNLSNWLGAYGVDRLPVEQVTDAVMAVYNACRDGLEGIV